VFPFTRSARYAVQSRRVRLALLMAVWMWTLSRLASTAGGRSDAHAASAALQACRPVLAEPAGQGLGRHGPRGRPVGEQRAAAEVAGVRTGGVELGADEGGEPGREEDRDGIEPQARGGAMLPDVGCGEPGQARGEPAVEQQERPGGPDVERDAQVAQAPAEQLPAAVFADEPGQLGRGRALAQVREVPQQVAATGGAIERVVDVGPGGGAQDA
jgi:hypothetical protein